MNVLITGAGSGIGKAVANCFAKNGQTVYAIDITPIEEVNGIKGYLASVADTESLIKVKNQLEEQQVKLDLIINVAGVFYMDNFLDGDEKEIARVMDVNFLGAVRVNKVFFDLLKPNGKIIVTSSEVAPYQPLLFNGIYGVSKSAVDLYAQCLRHEAGLLGIKVITVRPGAVETPLARSSFPHMKNMFEKTKYFKDYFVDYATMMKKFASKLITPEQLANHYYKIALKKKTKAVYSFNKNKGLVFLSKFSLNGQVKIVRKMFKK